MNISYPSSIRLFAKNKHKTSSIIFAVHCYNLSTQSISKFSLISSVFIYTPNLNHQLNQTLLPSTTSLLEPLTVSMIPERLIRVKEGDSASIECMVRNRLDFYHQTLSIEWLKDAKPLIFGSRIKLISQNKLRILSLLREDRGMYQCICKNEHDVAMAYIQLSLEGIIFGDNN